MKISRAVLSTLTLAAVMPMVALAQVTPPSGIIDTYSGVTTLLGKIASWLLGILLAAAVVFLIYAAFLYLTSGGDEEKLKSAKGYVIYAVIAVGIGILSYGLIALVKSFFGVTTS